MFTVGVRRKKRMNLKFPSGPTRVKVGYPSGAVTGAIVMRAIWNHYGTRGGASGGGWGGPIPPRPFLLNAVRRNQSKYMDRLRSEGRKIIRGSSNLRAVLAKLGAEATVDVQEEITNLKSPPNSPTTIRLKGSSNPLIDTGEMRAKTTWKIET
ncbi:hypothetical protein Pam3_10 [Pseudanabaena phage Pam3]|nr:hypothetical protein Pam3_10 [Pseudanabaena phage Pam3]